MKHCKPEMQIAISVQGQRCLIPPPHHSENSVFLVSLFFRSEHIAGCLVLKKASGVCRTSISLWSLHRKFHDSEWLVVSPNS